MPAKLAALYYPHMGIRNEGFLKNALLLWDEVSFICPYGDLPQRFGGDAQFAFEQIARPLVPSSEEKQQVHDAIVELVNSRLPRWFVDASLKQVEPYYIELLKLFPETWEELYQANLTKETTIYCADPPWPASKKVPVTAAREQRAYETTTAFGHLLMSMIADVCAGGTRQLVTEEVASYAWLDRYLKLIAGAEPKTKPVENFDRLVTLSIQTLNLSNVDMAALARVRANEGAELRKMRHSYVRKLDSYVKRLCTEAKVKSDVKEIERQFQQEVKDDIGLLLEELKGEAKKILFSREFRTAALIAAGGAIHPAIAAGAAVPLLQAQTQYKIARNKALAGHSMSWLYEAPRRFKLF